MAVSNQEMKLTFRRYQEGETTPEAWDD